MRPRSASRLRAAELATEIIIANRAASTVSDAVPAGAGRTLRFGGVSVFETSAGLCHAYREHFDRGAALLALGIRPTTVAGIVARKPSIEVSDG